MSITVADPGFPGGAVDSRGGNGSKILYVKTKESGHLGGIRQCIMINIYVKS